MEKIFKTEEEVQDFDKEKYIKEVIEPFFYENLPIKSIEKIKNTLSFFDDFNVSKAKIVKLTLNLYYDKINLKHVLEILIKGLISKNLFLFFALYDLIDEKNNYRRLKKYLLQVLKKNDFSIKYQNKEYFRDFTILLERINKDMENFWK